MINALTVDVEDYFQVSALAPYIDRAQWDTISCRVERNVDLLLERFAEADARVTFFTLGWIAERYPSLVRRIVEAGHELASHGHGHLRASDQTRDELLADLVSSRDRLEQIGGVAVRGYRAPSFSIGEHNLWAFECIREAGYRYSSSIYPIRHDHYGMPDAPRFPFEPIEGLLEIPITTFVAFSRNFPAGGGGYFRLAPYWLSRWAIRRVNLADARPAIFYMHPWEVDHAQPRVPGIGMRTRFRHYVNLRQTEPRLKRLLSDFRWGRMDEVFGLVGKGDAPSLAAAPTGSDGSFVTMLPSAATQSR